MIVIFKFYLGRLKSRHLLSSDAEVEFCVCVLPSDGDFGEDSQLGDAGDSRTGVVVLVRAEERIKTQVNV